MTDQPQELSRQERRKYPRIKTAVPLEFKTEGAAVASRTETSDLSLSGCYIEMSFTLAVATKLDLILWVEDEPLATKGIVVTHHPQFGNGIEFMEMSKDDQAKLNNFLEKQEKPEASAPG
jgi:c-di-GMP-binding flagellar brake protein YcgR